MITVIIPTLNEEEHIASVIQFAQGHPDVSEIIVVDDKSLDQTVSIARSLGATVITSTQLGKGASMREGVLCAHNEIVVFLDGDIDPYPADTIRLLTDPIIKGEAQFVKSKFNRNAGRVTELVAKPLMSLFFPDLAKFEQPLSGMIAGRKSILKNFDFRNDYGVDIGILIDHFKLNIPTLQVDIGYIKNKSKPWEALGKMSKEVAQTIILKAGVNIPNLEMDESIWASHLRSQLDVADQANLSKLDKIVVFDMDDTIIKGKFIDHFAGSFGLLEELKEIQSNERNPIILARQIANLLIDKSLDQILQVVDGIPIVSGAVETIIDLKRRGFIVGIISDSYDIITNHIKNKLGMDFSIANELEFSKSICTGEIKIPSYFLKGQDSICNHPVCKTNVLLKMLQKFGIPIQDAVVVGDHDSDYCMIEKSGKGVAFKADEDDIKNRLELVISTPSNPGMGIN